MKEKTITSKIKAKSAVLALLLVLAMILGQVSTILASSFAWGTIWTYEDTAYQKWTEDGTPIWCVDGGAAFGKKFSELPNGPSANPANTPPYNAYPGYLDSKDDATDHNPKGTSDRAHKRTKSTSAPRPITDAQALMFWAASQTMSGMTLTRFGWALRGLQDPLKDLASMWNNASGAGQGGADTGSGADESAFKGALGAVQAKLAESDPDYNATPEYQLVEPQRPAGIIPDDAYTRIYGRYQMTFEQAQYGPGEVATAYRDLPDLNNVTGLQQIYPSTDIGRYTESNPRKFQIFNPTQETYTFVLKHNGTGTTVTYYCDEPNQTCIEVPTVDPDRYYIIQFKIDPAVIEKEKTAVSPPAGTAVKAGAHIRYNIRVTNSGLGVSNNYPVEDTLSDYVRFVDAGGDGAVVQRPTGPKGGTVKWVIPLVETGAERYYDLWVEVEVLDMGLDECTRLIQNWNVTHIQCPADITIVKEAKPPHGSVVEQGQEIEYTLTVYNAGGQDSKGNLVRDTIPDGTTYVAGSANPAPTRVVMGKDSNGNDRVAELEWNNIDVTAANDGSGTGTGGSGAGAGAASGRGKTVITFRVTVDPLPKAMAMRELNNRVYLNGIPGNDTQHYVYGGTLNFSKTSVPPTGGIVKVGSDITYTIWVYNNGVDKINETTTVRDQIPQGTTLRTTPAAPSGNKGSTSSYAGAGAGAKTGTLTWTVPKLEPGEEFKFEFTVRVDDLPDGWEFREIKNMGQVDDWNTNETEHYVGSANVVGVKKSVPATGATVYDGQTIRFIIEVSNTGQEPAKSIVVTDSLPDDLIYTNSISYGGDASRNGQTKNGNDRYEFTWVIAELAPMTRTSVWFEAKVSEMPDGMSTPREFRNIAWVNGQGTNETVHTQHPGHLATAKRADPVSGTTVHENGRITYFIDVTNDGAETLYDIPVRDTLPVGVKNARVLASAFGTAPKPEPGGNGTAAGTLTGNTIDWTITKLFAGQKVTLSFDVIVDAMDDNETDRVIDNVAIVWGKETNHTVHPQKNGTLRVNKTANPPTGSTVYEWKSATVGDKITYTIAVKNNGNDPLHEVVIKDILPDDLIFDASCTLTTGATQPDGVGVTASQRTIGTTKQGNQRIEFTWVLSNPTRGLLPHESIVVSFQGKVDEMPAGVKERTFRNVATVNDVPTNETEHYQHSGSLKATKTSNPVPGALVHENGVITYTIEVYNDGADYLYNIPVVDKVPAGTTRRGTPTGVFSPVSTNGVAQSITPAWGASEGVDAAVWTISALASKQKAVLTFQVTVNRLDANGPEEPERLIENTARVDDFQTNTVTHVQKRGTLEISKKAEPPTGSTVYEWKSSTVGDKIKYTITVKNTGNDPLHVVTIRDQLPDDLVFDASCALTTGVTQPNNVEVNVVSTNIGQTKQGNNRYEFTWNLANEVRGLLPGESIVVSFEGKVDKMPAGVKERTFKNIATVNNVPTNETEHYQHSGSLKATKTSNPTPGTLVHENDTITYTIEVYNDGADFLYNI
ncbi:MAG: DUF11 domain-containing protein, partial [Oscillospiraceae bacterium]|nr:DUF11 domain-containing protein [Oscillospiraceae bacterium]